MNRARTLVFGVLAAAFAVGAASADEPAAESTVRNEVRATVDAVNAAVRAGISPAGLVEMLFAPDLVAVGEGEPGARRGGRAYAAVVKEHWDAMGPDGQKKCLLALAEETGVSSADVYASFFTLTCEPNPPSVTEASVIRGIYVWKRLPEGWRVVLEQWGVGALGL